MQLKEHQKYLRVDFIFSKMNQCYNTSILYSKVHLCEGKEGERLLPTKREVRLFHVTTKNKVFPAQSYFEFGHVLFSSFINCCEGSCKLLTCKYQNWLLALENPFYISVLLLMLLIP